MRVAALFEALLALLDFADWEAAVMLELEAALDDLDAFAAKVADEFAVFAALAFRVALVVPVSAVDVFEVELLAEAPFDASAGWFAPPETAVLFAPLFDLLLKVELSVAFAVPVGVAVAFSVVPEVLPAFVAVLALVPARLAFAVLDLLALAFNAALAVEALVADLVSAELLEAVALLVFEADLLEVLLALSDLVELSLEVALLVLDEVLVTAELLVAL